MEEFLENCTKKLIGNGNFSEVYELLPVERSMAPCRLALKCMKKHKQIARREAALLNKLNHPNIIQVYSYLEDREGSKTIMEYLPTNALDLYEQKERLP